MISVARHFDLDAPLWPRLCIAVLLALLILQGARLFWLMLSAPSLPPPVVTAPLPTAIASQGSPKLGQWHLFGNSGAAVDLAQLAQAAPATALQLVLRGTLNESSPAGGIAIIADENAEERPYRVGDELPGGARLKAIYRGRVLLSRGGSDESLSLPESQIGRIEPAAGAAAAPVGGSPLPFAIEALPAMNFGGPQLETARSAAQANIAELAKQVNVLPVLENGRFAGVRLSPGRDAGALDRAGLRTTDIITAVNGIPLDGPQRMAELLAQLRDARQFSVSIKRDGEAQTLTVGF